MQLIFCFLFFVSGVTVKKDGCLTIPPGRNGGGCIALDGKLFLEGRLVHITLLEFAAICTIASFAYTILKDIIIACTKRK